MVKLSLNKESGMYELIGPGYLYPTWNGEISYAKYYYNVWPISNETIRMIERANPYVAQTILGCVVVFNSNNESDILECAMILVSIARMELEII